MSLTQDRPSRQAPDFHKRLNPVPCGFCYACDALVPLSTITGYERNGGNTPLCAACSPLDRCDDCGKDVPHVFCQSVPAPMFLGVKTLCHWCTGQPGFWPEVIESVPMRCDNCGGDAAETWETARTADGETQLLCAACAPKASEPDASSDATADAYECPFEEIGDVSTHSRRAAA